MRNADIDPQNAKICGLPFIRKERGPFYASLSVQYAVFLLILLFFLRMLLLFCPAPCFTSETLVPTHLLSRQSQVFKTNTKDFEFQDQDS